MEESYKQAGIQICSLATHILLLGDRFNKDGLLSLTECRNCLTGTPYEKFAQWLTASGRFKQFDQNKDGVLSKQELGPALEAYMQEAYSDIDFGIPERANEMRAKLGSQKQMRQKHQQPSHANSKSSTGESSSSGTLQHSSVTLGVQTECRDSQTSPGMFQSQGTRVEDVLEELSVSQKQLKATQKELNILKQLQHTLEMQIAEERQMFDNQLKGLQEENFYQDHGRDNHKTLTERSTGTSSSRPRRVVSRGIGQVRSTEHTDKSHRERSRELAGDVGEEGPAPPEQFRMRNASPRGMGRLMSREHQPPRPTSGTKPSTPRICRQGVKELEDEKLRNLQTLKYEGHNPDEEEEDAVLPEIRGDTAQWRGAEDRITSTKWARDKDKYQRIHQRSKQILESLSELEPPED